MATVAILQTMTRLYSQLLVILNHNC